MASGSAAGRRGEGKRGFKAARTRAQGRREVARARAYRAWNAMF